ncbi:MAG: site-specific DNA-methyltransferase, partial [Candidatus Kapaibacterium sp.]
MNKQDFIQAGFTVVGTETNENKLLSFLKENYPNVIKDNEINLDELKAIAGLPIDEKVNGYGLNFVGRNFARAKYAQKTDKELRLNTQMSKNIDTTENLVLKGDNLDSLKILKSHYSGKIKCIYIDPPYNTTSDEFVYPDKFDKEEAEVLGLANLSESDFARMDFSFKSKKSHNGWLAFMYPRLLLARDLLSKEGVIFISIDDNEQANLKLLCDDVFGEENFVGSIVRATGTTTDQGGSGLGKSFDYLLVYSKLPEVEMGGLGLTEKDVLRYNLEDDRGKFSILQLRRTGSQDRREDRPNMFFPMISPDNTEVFPIGPTGYESRWRVGKAKAKQMVEENLIYWKKNDAGEWVCFFKYYLEGRTKRPSNLWTDVEGNKKAQIEM